MSLLLCSGLDFEVSKNLLATSVITLEAEKNWIANLSTQDVRTAIVDLKTERLLGNAGLHFINHINCTAEFGIFIGDAEFRSKGYGTEATKLILDFGFNVLNLHNIMLKVYAYNQGGIGCYQKVGFKEIGRRREAKIIAGTMYDEVFMDILATEFESPFVKKFFE